MEYVVLNENSCLNMQNFLLANTNKSPHVVLDAQKGLIELKGSSIMENSRAFYEPIIAWVNKYTKEPKDTLVHLDFEYFNSSTAKAFLMLFKALGKIKEAGFTLKVEWLYPKDDDDLKECGMNYASIVDADFQFIEKNNVH